jgi:hypothetical protein
VLAVAVGNVHGLTTTPVSLDLERLAAIRNAVVVPLVLHGASCLPDEQVSGAIRCGVAKININTELRKAYWPPSCRCCHRCSPRTTASLSGAPAERRWRRHRPLDLRAGQQPPAGRHHFVIGDPAGQRTTQGGEPACLTAVLTSP